MPRVTRLAPVNLPAPVIPHDDQSPPLPPLALVPAAKAEGGLLHRRGNGSELPWLRRAEDDAFATYEIPASDERGRYLWIVLDLAGNTRATPRVRAVRVERPRHDLLARLPRTLSREAEAERFLARYLSPLSGLLGELDARAWLREALFDPHSAPEEALAWLAEMVGLALDERWSVPVRRRVVAEVMPLFRVRGTVGGLKRFLQIVTGVEPIIIEKFRLRGGAVIGEPVARSSRAIVGGGLRVGGKVGDATAVRLPGATPDADAFDTHAHRFTVMLPARLSEEAIAVAAHVLDVHRPAHTLYDLCTVASGMRVGRGLHLGLTAVVGRSSAWQPLLVGSTPVGRGTIVGRPEAGMRPASSRLGVDTRVG
jgi:phage tail-like protein